MQKTDSAPIYGLVLAGGMSSRMKRDKGEIRYHDVSQVEYTYNLLKEYCEEVFVSCKKEQRELPHLKNFPQIHDQFLEGGSLGAILSAMNAYPNAAWLVFACDLPMLDSTVIKTLLANREDKLSATAFYHLDEKRFEPLAALYEPKSSLKMQEFLNLGKSCPQKVLYNSEVKIININKDDLIERKLLNANTPEDYKAVMEEKNL